VTCVSVEDPRSDVARRRPVFALMVHDEDLAAVTGLTPVPVGKIEVPWGQRYPQINSTLYRLYPPDRVP